jgi:hypothetical protein
MNDLNDGDLMPEPISIARCREQLGDEARELSDEDIDAIRRHAQAMAHTVVELFLHQQIDSRG